MLYQRLVCRIPILFMGFRNCRSGNFGIIIALLIPLLVVVAGGAIDLLHAMGQKSRYQVELDAAVLAAVKEAAAGNQFATARSYIHSISDPELTLTELQQSGVELLLTTNADGSLSGTLRMPHPTSFLRIVHLNTIPITVSSTAILIENGGGGGAGTGIQGSDVGMARLIR